MTRDEVLSRVSGMIAETFELDPATVTAESNLYTDLELDSIDALDLVVKLQEFMKRRVEETELRELRTVGDVVDLVMKNLAEPAPE